jgi:HSP20 family molecular chaperone IbpA
MSSKATIPVRRLDSLSQQEVSRIHDRLRERAFAHHERRGMPGNDWDDWFQAERELVLSPALTMVESDDHFVMLFSAPSLDSRDIEILVSDDSVVLKSVTQPDDVRGTVHAREFDVRQVFRHVPLPKRIQPESIHAEFKGGTLRVSARLEEAAGYRARSA